MNKTTGKFKKRNKKRKSKIIKHIGMKGIKVRLLKFINIPYYRISKQLKVLRRIEDKKVSFL